VSKLPVGVDQQQLYVVARRVLLDALVALQDHRDGVILIGAQAVYVHAADAHLGVAAYTSDGDLALDPVNLGQHPLIEAAMVSAGFSLNLRNDPGRWLKQQTVGSTPTNIMVDLLIPEGLSEGGRRSARIPPHDPRAFLRVSGIEAAIVDNRVFTLASLEPQADSRTVEVRIAGVAALLLSKAIKISQRLNDSARRPDRLQDKDASDVVALMMTSDVDKVTATFGDLLRDDRTQKVTRTGLGHFHQLFGASRAPGVEMATRALNGIQELSTVVALATAFTAQMPQG
jgi:hypothetical protein